MDNFLLVRLFSVVFCLHVILCSNRSFSVDWDNKQFVKDGEPFRYISGSIHYTRIPNSEWADRLAKVKAAGLNTIETYVQWNFHSPEDGVYDFKGDRDVEKFLQLANETGLLVIIRGFPYTCAEWEFGGFPWYLVESGSILRSKDPKWLTYVDRWLDIILPILKPYLYANGGPIIMVQFENEYGSYHTIDHEYLENLVSKCREHLGSEVVLFTTDRAHVINLEKGALKSELATVDFGVTDHPERKFWSQRFYQPNAPLVNSEFYTGWLNHWGSPFTKVSATAFASSLDKVLALNASVNIYMFVGGTNFGYWNGANWEGADLYSITSYDYDSPISEAGDTTWKYFQIKETIGKYYPDVLPLPVPSNRTKTSLDGVKLELKGNLLNYFDILSNSTQYQKTTYPQNMEKLRFGYGFVMYRTKLCKDYPSGSVLKFSRNGVRDRATVLISRGDSYNSSSYLGTVNNKLYWKPSLKISKSLNESDYLYFIVENRGRVNFGFQMQHQAKGLVGNVTLNNEILTNWETVQLKLENLGTTQVASTSSSSTEMSLPLVYQTEVQLNTNDDTFLNTTSFSRGIALIDNFNLGRYWPTKGPQQTLFVPKASRNSEKFLLTLIEFEREAENGSTVDFLDYPILDGPV